MKNKVFYYSDPKTDDFSGTNITKKPLKDNYKYIRKNIFWKCYEFFIYRIIAKPVFFLYLKIRFHHKFVNKKLIKKSKNTGAILYANHTALATDAFVPNMVSHRKNYIIVSPETLSISGIKLLLNALGAIPLTDKLALKKQFLKAVKTRLNKKCLITIYPEAHIWPYYTKIRPYDEASFKYASSFNVPVYAITNCYQKRKIRRLPKIVTFIDGPFYPKEGSSKEENALYLRDMVYQKMVERTEKYSTYEYVKYVYKPKDTSEN